MAAIARTRDAERRRSRFACLQYIVSCNDSAMRLYGMDRGVLQNEFRGHKNSIHLRASLSADRRFALVGSEPSSIYIYEIGDEASRRKNRVRRHFERTAAQ